MSSKKLGRKGGQRGRKGEIKIVVVLAQRGRKRGQEKKGKGWRK